MPGRLPGLSAVDYKSVGVEKKAGGGAKTIKFARAVCRCSGLETERLLKKRCHAHLRLSDLPRGPSVLCTTGKKRIGVMKNDVRSSQNCQICLGSRLDSAWRADNGASEVSKKRARLSGKTASVLE